MVGVCPVNQGPGTGPGPDEVGSPGMIPVGQQNEAHTLVDDCRQFFLPWWHGIDADIAGGIKDQMTVEFVSVWFRKPRLGENVGDVVIGYPAGRCGLLPERVIDDPILLRRNVAALLALDFNILLVGDGESILSHANDRLDQLAREFTDQCGNQ